jgi:single-stranded-DNA-specific exonuclease
MLAESIVSEYKSVGVSVLLATVLNNRGLAVSTADKILNSPFALLTDPLGMVNMKQGVSQIIKAIESGAEIWIFADYDCDGMTSGFTLSDFLKSTTDNDVYPYYPNRTEGYGLNMDFCKMMVARREEIGKEIFIITVDNGTACIEQVKFLNENGIGVVVTDHHQPKGTLPDCTIINPQIVEDDTYKHLCGAGVAFKLIQAIETMAVLPNDYTSKYYYAVAMGTIADMMPLTLENMALIRLGLNQINSKDCPYAIKLWKEFLGKKQITPMDIGWEIGPRLNACGRMEASDLGGLLLSYNEDTDRTEVMDTLLEIEDINQERKALTDKAKKEIAKNDYSSDYVCMFNASEYPAGIAGIIAGKLLEQTGKPSIVFSGKERFVGSVRSPHGFNIQPILENEFKKGNLLEYGGHEEAAGLKFSLDRIYDLQESLNETVAEIIASLPPVDSVATELEVDAEISLKDVNTRNFLDLQLFPYDRNVFTAPVFVLKELEVTTTKRSKNNEKNICLTVKDESGKSTMIWAWGYGELYEQLGEPDKINLIGSIDMNFIDKRSATFKVMAMEAA